MNETDTFSAVNWTKTPDGGWEASVSGVTYLIERHGDEYYLYRGLEREQIESNKSLLLLKRITECL